MSDIIFEVCAGSYADCIAAQNGGANRVELNNALYLGGLTPSLATVSLVKKNLDITVAAMVRPRAGGFNYDEIEYEVMVEDAKALLNLGVEGIVFGFLHDNFEIDEKRTSEFVELIHTMGGEAIVHRAFDLVLDADQAMQALIRCGVDRVLTSGLAPTAVEGCAMLKHLEATYGDEIEILAGVGLRSENVSELIAETKVKQVHSSCKGWKVDLTANQGDIKYGYDANHMNESEYVIEELVSGFAKEIKK